MLCPDSYVTNNCPKRKGVLQAYADNDCPDRIQVDATLSNSWKWKNLLRRASKCFPLRADPFSERVWCAENNNNKKQQQKKKKKKKQRKKKQKKENKKSQKLSPLTKMAGIKSPKYA